MTKKCQRQVLEHLGPQYISKHINGSLCVYRRLSDTIDVGITGKITNFCVFVWDISKGLNHGAYVIDSRSGIKGLEELTLYMKNLEQKYMKGSWKNESGY